MSKTVNPRHFKVKKTTILQIIIVVVALVILVPQFQQFSTSWSLIKNASPPWFALAILFKLGAVTFAALVYITLVPKRLPFRRTMNIQLATYFTNRLLPSGLGGIGLNTLYIAKQTKLSKSESAVYATANNLVGFIAFSICIGLASLIDSMEMSLPNLDTFGISLGLVALMTILLSLLSIPRFRDKVLSTLKLLARTLGAIASRPFRLVLAIAFSVGITISYVAVLWASTRSVGIEISIIQLFIAFIAGNVALSVSPTPGGIGLVEAAITATLISLGVGPSVALAGVVVFRLVSYWIPILPGYAAFRYATRYGHI